MKALYAALADLIVAVHLLYVFFAVGGEAFILLGAFCGWKVIRGLTFRVCHLAAVGLVALEAATGIDCPLTVWESDLRLLAGQKVEHLSFMARMMRELVFYNFSPLTFTIMHIGFGFLVVFTFILIPPRLRKGRRNREVSLNIFVSSKRYGRIILSNAAVLGGITRSLTN
jgi:hypothetical protein